MTIEQDYIDPTRELEDVALASKLAELWATYVFSISDTSFSQVAQSITPLLVEAGAIVFEIGIDWVPPYAKGPGGAAVREGGHTAIAYLRQTGEFLPLGSAKGMARLLEYVVDGLSAETMGRVLSLIEDCHRPQWFFATDADDVARLQSRRNDISISPPQLQTQNGSSSLTFWGAGGAGLRQWQISYDDTRLIPWRVE